MTPERVLWVVHFVVGLLFVYLSAWVMFHQDRVLGAVALGLWAYVVQRDHRRYRS